MLTRILLVQAAASIAVLLGESSRIAAWRMRDGTDDTGISHIRRNLVITDEVGIDINFKELKSVFGEDKKREFDDIEPRTSSADSSNINLEFALPDLDQPLSCNLTNSALFHPELAEKFPDLILKTGHCDDGRTVSFNMRLDVDDSLSASFSVPGSSDWLFVDNKQRGKIDYVLRRRSKLSNQQQRLKKTPFSCTIRHEKQNSTGDQERRFLQQQLTISNGRNLSQAASESCKASVPELVLDKAQTESTISLTNKDPLDTVVNKFSCGEVLAGASSKLVRFRAPSAGIYSFTTCQSARRWDAVIRIALDSCQAQSWVECNDDSARGSTCSFEHVHLEANQLVYIQVAAFGGASLPQSFSLTVIKTAFSGVTFRLALIANRQYSVKVGGSALDVASAVALIMARVNGIYMRELGIFLQLIRDNDGLFCSDENVSSMGGCTPTLLPNDASIIDMNKNFIESVRGIPSSAYDIGHSFTTGSGGIAGLGVICTSNKADGTTGSPEPFGDPFAVDYVIHEMGHQFGAQHSFRYCLNQQSNMAPEFAVEPGSASTVMSYAGICGGQTNLQANSDPYFHSSSLHSIRNHVLNRLYLLPKSSCGVASPDVPMPSSIMFPRDQQTCVLPANSYFQLRLTEDAFNPVDSSADWFFQWDEIDRRPNQDYLDLNLPRFRSWVPTRMRSRYFPSLGFLANNLLTNPTYQRMENVPRNPTNMRFRVTARSRYSTSATSPRANFSTDAGEFVYADYVVTFDSSQRLSFTTATKSTLKLGIESGEILTFKWTPGGTIDASPKIKILYAIDTLPRLSTGQSFSYERDVHELKWRELGEFPNKQAQAEVDLPVFSQEGAEEETNPKLMFMIRTTALENCFAFDVIEDVPFASRVMTPSPTPKTKFSLCSTAPNLGRAACQRRMKKCKQKGQKMFFAGKSCKSDSKDGGCQCRSSCYFNCEANCVKNKNCLWIKQFNGTSQGACVFADNTTLLDMGPVKREC